MVAITIQGSCFKTQKELEKHVRKLLHELGPTNDVAAVSRKTFTFLFELLERHPNASTKLHNFKQMVVQPVGHLAYGLLIRYEDGTLDDISWKVCVSGKTPSPKHAIASAYRQAIQDQIDRFRTENETTSCTHCHCDLSSSGCHVDHIVPFVDLINAFTIQCELTVPNEIMSAPLCLYRHRFLKTDDKFEDAWRSFHEQHAILQITCAPCNLSALRILRNGPDSIRRAGRV